MKNFSVPAEKPRVTIRSSSLQDTLSPTFFATSDTAILQNSFRDYRGLGFQKHARFCEIKVDVDLKYGARLASEPWLYVGAFLGLMRWCLGPNSRQGWDKEILFDLL